MKKTIIWLFTLTLNFKDTVAPCHNDAPAKTWPLGQGILNREIISNDPPESRGIFGYTPTNLGYNGLYFYGNVSSYVDLKFDGSSEDYTLYFYVNPTVQGGCIMHYKSFPSIDTGITEYRLDMNSDGTLTFSVKTNGVGLVNGGSDKGAFVVPLNVWSIIIIEYDISKEFAEITLDDGSEMTGDVIVIEAIHVGPGITRIASPQDGTGTSFRGGISCLHTIHRKDICLHSIYETNCNSNWPSTTKTSTTTSTTTTSTPTTSTTTTSTPTTSTTTTSTPTTSTTTTSTPTTSTTTTSTPTTSTTTKSTPTTSTTTTSTPTTSTTTTTSTPTTSTTTTSTPTTSTTTTSTPTTSTTTTSTPTTSTTTTSTPTTSTTTTSTPTTSTTTTSTPITSTTTTTSTPTTSTTTTSSTPTTSTTTTTSTPTTSTTTTTSTPTTSTTTTSTPTTSTSTTSTPTTSTSMTTATASTSTTAPTIPASSTIPTTITPTRTSLSTTSSTHTMTSSTSIALSTSISPIEIQTGWRRCHKLGTSATFTDNNDVISVKPVNDVRDCLLECNKYADCIQYLVQIFTYAGLAVP